MEGLTAPCSNIDLDHGAFLGLQPNTIFYKIRAFKAQMCSLSEFKRQLKHSLSCKDTISDSLQLCCSTSWITMLTSRLNSFMRETGKLKGVTCSFLVAMFHVIGIPLAGGCKSILLSCWCPINEVVVSIAVSLAAPKEFKAIGTCLCKMYIWSDISQFLFRTFWLCLFTMHCILNTLRGCNRRILLMS